MRSKYEVGRRDIQSELRSATICFSKQTDLKIYIYIII